MVKALSRKRLRDLVHLRGQVVAIALVVACGVAVVVTSRASYESLVISQATYYAEYRFADVFASLKRAPESLRTRIAAIPGVAAVETRIVAQVTLDVPGLEEPATGRLVSVPERRVPILNDLHLRSGRWLEPGRRDEVMASEAFAKANRLTVGSTIGAVLHGRWQELTIVGIALSPEYVYEIQGTSLFPDNKRFGVLWISRDAVGPPFQMEGAFNDVSIRLTADASRGFLYATAVMGVTGAREASSVDAPALVSRVRQATKLPVGVGLGVSTGAQAAEIGAYADAVIVGSALVRQLMDVPDVETGLSNLRALVEELAEGVHRARR